MNTNDKFFNHFGKWRGNSGFVIFMTPPSNKDIVASFASHDCPCFIKDVKVVNTSCLPDGSTEIWWKSPIVGPFFCDVNEVFHTLEDAEAKLSMLAQAHIELLQTDIESMQEAQQRLRKFIKDAS